MSTGKHNIQRTPHVPLAGRQRAPRTGLRGGRGRSYTLSERLESRTIKGPGCWQFQGCKVGPNGYGQIMRDPKSRKLAPAHVVAWELANGRRVPEGLRVCHSCDNPRCVNPTHLFVATQRGNVHDCIHKGRRNAFGHQKLHVPDVLEIRRRGASGERHAMIAKAFGVARNTVTSILSGASWKHLPLFGRSQQVPQDFAVQPQDGLRSPDVLHRSLDLVGQRVAGLKGH